MSITVRIGKTRETVDVAATVEAGVATALRRVVVDTAAAVAARARGAVPVSTGELRSTIRSEAYPNGLHAVVMAGYGRMPHRAHVTASGRKVHRSKGSGIQRGAYAPIIEFGDAKRHKPARPFFFPSAEAEKSAFVERASAAIKRAVNDVASGAPTGAAA